MICQNCGCNHNSPNGVCPNCGAPANNGYPQMNQNPQNGYGQNGYPQMNQNPQNGYGQNGYGQNGYSQMNSNPNGFNNMGGNFSTAIIQKDIVLCIVLSIVTCGIYGIIWFISITDDLNVATNDINGRSGGMTFLLTLVTCGIYGFIWAYKCGEKVSYIKQRQGYPADTTTPVLYLLLQLFGLGIVVYALVQSELNKVAMPKQ